MLGGPQSPPLQIKSVYKEIKGGSQLDTCKGLFDWHTSSTSLVPHIVNWHNNPNEISDSFSAFQHENFAPKPQKLISFPHLPGLVLLPNYLPIPVQAHLLDLLTNSYVPCSENRSNLHLHYHVPNPFNAFTDTDLVIRAHNPDLVKQSTLVQSQILKNKLRWITLGAQYDWTNKEYPSLVKGSTLFPDFPSELSTLLAPFHIASEAAIVNFYSSGDTLSPHRDVSELCQADLISLSIGCDAVFLCGLDDGLPLQLLLHSGDAIVMSAESRFAWHAVPKIVADTCPPQLANYEWDNPIIQSWIKTKRVNINVRQVFNE